MKRNCWIRLGLSLVICWTMSASLVAQAAFSIQGPGVDPNDFRITQFAGGLNYPVCIIEGLIAAMAG